MKLSIDIETEMRKFLKRVKRVKHYLMENNEQKLTAQVAGAYYGSRVKCTEGETTKIGTITGIRGDVVGVNFKGWQSSWIDYPNCQLVLTRLEDITDEHLIEVVKIITKRLELPDVDYVVKRDTEGAVVVVDESIVVCLYPTGDLVMSDESVTNALPVLNKTQADDYLRSKSYMIPFMGIDLFEAKVAVDAKTLPL